MKVDAYFVTEFQFLSNLLWYLMCPLNRPVSSEGSNRISRIEESSPREPHGGCERNQTQTRHSTRAENPGDAIKTADQHDLAARIVSF